MVFVCFADLFVMLIYTRMCRACKEEDKMKTKLRKCQTSKQHWNFDYFSNSDSPLSRCLFQSGEQLTFTQIIAQRQHIQKERSSLMSLFQT